MYEDVQHSGYIGMQSDRLCNCVYLFRYQDFVYGHEYYYFVKKNPIHSNNNYNTVRGE